MTTKTLKTDPDRIRLESIRMTARRRGLTLMCRGQSLWIVRDGKIVAGGPQGLTIAEVEHLIRAEGFGRPALADAS